MCVQIGIDKIKNIKTQTKGIPVTKLEMTNRKIIGIKFKEMYYGCIICNKSKHTRSISHILACETS